MNKPKTNPRKPAPRPAPRGSSSPAGWHFVEEARTCPWRFYLHRVLGVIPRFLPRELCFGQAFHAGKEAFYLGKTSPVEEARAVLAALAPLYEDEAAYDVDSQRLGFLLEAWITAFGEADLAHFDILGVELEAEVRLPSGNIFTTRMDAVVGPRGGSGPGHVRVLETKTTGFSVVMAAQGVRVGGQARGYALACEALFPGRAVDVVADIAYWRKGDLSPANIRCERADPLEFGPAALADFAVSLDQSLSEITQRVASFYAGEPAARCFPRVQSPGICCAFNRTCEYFGVCEAAITPGEDLRDFGYEWDEEILTRHLARPRTTPKTRPTPRRKT